MAYISVYEGDAIGYRVDLLPDWVDCCQREVSEAEYAELRWLKDQMGRLQRLLQEYHARPEVDRLKVEEKGTKDDGQTS